MAIRVEQIALKQAFSRLDRLINLPDQGTRILDLSGPDADVAQFFLEKGCEAARLEGEGHAHEGIAQIKGLAGATGLPDQSVDFVCLAGEQAKICDRNVLFEAARILKPRAGIILSYTRPVALPGTVAFLSENLALQFNPFWDRPADPHGNSRHLGHLAMSGFVGGEAHCLDVALSFTREQWVDYFCAQPIIADAHLSPAELQDFRLVLHDYIRRDFGTSDFYVPFRTLSYLAFRVG